ncbi:MAG TPA: hypothetical protein PK600_04650 [Deltaproteobacteria bacterium]|nr:hypothetical protein [Deltaproteobacteria bacterium]
MGKLLANKDAIMKYLTVRERTLDDFISRWKLPCFRVGGKLMANTDAIDEWSYKMSMSYVQLDAADETERNGKEHP